jgi:hypothetical protein
MSVENAGRTTIEGDFKRGGWVKRWIRGRGIRGIATGNGCGKL